MSKAEMVLKVVMDVSKPEDLVLNYARLLPKSDANELQKILEMKSLKRADIAQIVQLYRTKIDGVAPQPAASATASATSAMPSAFSAVISLAADGISDSSMRRLEKLVKKKL